MAKNKTGVIILPLAKMHKLADRGKGSDEIAQLIGITKEEMFDRLSLLGRKNQKSAKAIRTKIEYNDTRTTRRQTAQEEPTPTPEETKHEAPKTETTEAQTEILQLQKAISKCEEALGAIIQKQEQASRTILDSKAKALEHETSLKALIVRLEELKRTYEGEIEKVREAEQVIISCEAEQVEKNLELLRLTTRLQTLMKPVVLVYTNGLETENVNLPESIDTSGWAQLIDALPKEIGDEISRKEAMLLLKLKAIKDSNPNADIIFDDGLELVQLAYEAMP